MTKPKKARAQPRDIAILHGPTEDGQGQQVLRLRHGQLSAGEIRPVKEGQDLTQRELVRLRPLPDHEGVCEVEVLHGEPPASPASARSPDSQPDAQPSLQRPARVATERYRKNWSTIFHGKRKARGPSDWSVN
jgi:hypothetical protein